MVGSGAISGPPTGKGDRVPGRRARFDRVRPWAGRRPAPSAAPRRANVIEFGAAGRVCTWARLIVFAARGIEACEVAARTVQQVEAVVGSSRPAAHRSAARGPRITARNHRPLRL